MSGRIIAVLLALAAVAAAEQPDYDPVLAEVGAPLFARYCAACHGAAARGDGPAAEAMRKPPPDLTAIAARRGGTFPASEIARFIDGRFEVPSHGSREMPVWGQRFGADVPEPGIGESIARGNIASLVQFLKSIQQPPRAQEPDPAETRRIMREVFAALQRVLPPSLDEKRFADPSLRPEIQKSLGTLSRNAGRLEAHAAGRGESFAFLARSLAREAAEIERRYRAGRFREAQFELHEFTETCVACHSRLPDTEDAALSSRFMDEAEIAALPLPERARLAMATRQFERALEAQEAMLASLEFDANSIDLLGYLDDYLEVCLRVKGDFERPASKLAAFAKRSDVRPGLRDEVKNWVSDLRALGARGPIEGFEAGRDLARETEAAVAKRGERALLVRFQAASGTLHRWLASVPDGEPRTAEAYYWLGMIESRIGRSFWLSQTEPYLEAAIRHAPDDPLADEAFARLEEFVAAGYTGSSGEHVPSDVEAWLEELARLVANTGGGR